MHEKYKGAEILPASEKSCCFYAVNAQHKKLITGLKYVSMSLSVHSPSLKSFHAFKAREKLSEVALQSIYPKGRYYALLGLRLLH